MYTEPRKIITSALCIAMLASLFDVCFILRWNLLIGIPDIVWVVFTTTSLGTLLVAFIALPPNVLFAKLTPAHVEATMMAFTGSCTACIMPLSKMMGVLINKNTINVSTDNLGDLYKLYLIQMLFCLVPLIYIRLLPTWAQVNAV